MKDFYDSRVHRNKTVTKKQPPQKTAGPKYFKKKKMRVKATAAQYVSDQQITGVLIDMRIYICFTIGGIFIIFTSDVTFALVCTEQRAVPSGGISRCPGHPSNTTEPDLMFQPHALTLINNCNINFHPACAHAAFVIILH